MTNPADPSDNEPRITLDLTLTEVDILFRAMASTGNTNPALSYAYRPLFKRLGDLLAARRGQ